MTIINFCIAHKEAILPFLGLIWSEILSSPRFKSSGIVQFINNVLTGVKK